jgi:hypothetical protein
MPAFYELIASMASMGTAECRVKPHDFARTPWPFGLRRGK